MRAVSARLALLAVVVCGVMVAGCSHADYSPLTVPAASASSSPSAAGSASPTASPVSSAPAVPAACGTPFPNSVYLAIGSYIEPQTPANATYGTIYGYALTDSSGDYPLQSAPIDLRPGDTIQFVNVDPAAASGANGTSHSAAGFGSASFPATYTFPSQADLPIGATLSNTALWSTGEIPAEANVLCYSQTFTIPASGTYYFGDVDFYDSTSMRDVIIVSANAAQRRRTNNSFH